MNYLLDTCVVSELRKKRPNSGLAEWINAQEEWQLFLSVLTLGEIEYGISLLRDKHQSELLTKWLYEFLIPRFQHRILRIDEEIVIQWGKMRGSSEKKGKILPVIDSLLAATALVHGTTVVTRNQKDFEGCGCKVENPWKVG